MKYNDVATPIPFLPNTQLTRFYGISFLSMSIFMVLLATIIYARRISRKDKNILIPYTDFPYLIRLVFVFGIWTALFVAGAIAMKFTLYR